jgi:tetratricopeptide (TPR) repeat protein
LERFTDHLGKIRQRLSLMLCGLALLPLALSAKPEPKKEKSPPKPVAKSKASLKGECKDENTVECWNALAVSLARQGRLEDARLALERAFQADPQLVALRGNLEKLYGNLARQAYDSALGFSQEKGIVDLALLPESSRKPVRDRLASSVAVPHQPAPVIAAPVVQAPVAATARVASVPAPTIPVPAVMPATASKPRAAAPTTPAPSVIESVASVSKIPKPLPLVASAAVRKDSIKQAVPAAKVPVPVVAAVPRVPVARLLVKPAKVKEEVRKSLDAWGAHWAAKDVEGYLSWYAPEFLPANGAQRSAWETLRRERISAPASIEVTLESVRIEPDDSGRVVSQFIQSYRTESVRLRSRKRLLWKRIDDAWKIVSEGEAK